jgi:hypothetical protein
VSAARSPQIPSPFTLGTIVPTNVLICKACKTPILKSPPPPTTPKLNLHLPARSHLEARLQSSLLQARARAVNIQAAYASASAEYKVLGNEDGLVIVNKDGSKEVTFADHPEWRHAPYTAEVCKIVGTLYGELGRALATSQKTVSVLTGLLEEEMLRLQAGDDEEQRVLRKEWEEAWFESQKAERIEAAKPKKRKRNRKG